MPKIPIAKPDPWQELDSVQTLASNAATGSTQSPRDQVKSIAVVLFQTNTKGEITRLQCGIATPSTKNFKAAAAQGADKRYTWTVPLNQVDNLKPLVKGTATGISIVQRSAGLPEGWTDKVRMT